MNACSNIWKLLPFMADFWLVLLIWLLASETPEVRQRDVLPLKVATQRKADSTGATDQETGCTIALRQQNGATCRLLDGQSVSQDELLPRLRERLAVTQKETVYLNIDDRVPHGAVNQLMKSLSRNGIKRLFETSNPGDSP
ncbi:MAG: biopolymer transporter ExbD [Verrucomicrobia bacterium]|nr:biopolymer transporter ExbD [Verrucomicrobiota bacterium]